MKQSSRSSREREKRIDKYITDYSVRSLAEMLVDLEDEAEPYMARKAARSMKRAAEAGRAMREKLKEQP